MAWGGDIRRILNVMDDSIYLDHAATTPVAPEVLEAMRPFFTEQYGNPSSVHAQGRSARFAVEEARERVAVILGAEPAEVVFTSGGTEANNLAIFGILQNPSEPDYGFVTSAVEHESVLRSAQRLASAGRSVTVLKPMPSGRVEPQIVEEHLAGDVGLASLMWVNNELGTINPVREIAALCRERGVLFHTDGVQAAGLFAESTAVVAPDLMTISAHKLGGPKGVGALLVRSGTPLSSHILGGSQERRRRAGTENVAGIVGLAAALDRAASVAETERVRLSALRRQLVDVLQANYGDSAHINSPLDGPAAPHILSVSFGGGDGRVIDGEMLLLALDMAGVMVSSGSACASGSIEMSHVLRALDIPDHLAAATVRFSFGRTTTPEAIERAVAALAQALERQGLTARSPAGA
jgi:cysteine desulfurase